VGGLVTPAYEIDVDPAKLAASGLTLDDVIATVGADNARVPGGTVYEANRQTTVDIRGDIQNIGTVASLPIQTSSGGSAASTSGASGTTGATSTYEDGLAGLPGTVDTWTASNAVLRIEDVAKVIAGYEPRQQYAQISGRRDSSSRFKGLQRERDRRVERGLGGAAPDRAAVPRH